MNHALRAGSAREENQKNRGDRLATTSAGGVFRGSKRTCAERARWRLVRGQSAQRLSIHYQLECDFGTSTLSIYNDGDPVFLCEGHVSAIQGPRDNCIAGVRPVEGALEGAENPAAGRDVPRSTTFTEEALAAMASPRQEGFRDRNVIESAAAQNVAEAPVDFASTADHLKTAEMEDPPPAARAAEPMVQEPAVSGASLRTEHPAAPKAKREIAVASFRAPARDLAYGNPAKALVDETIWNMAAGDFDAYASALQQGKTPMEAAQAAGGQLAVVHRKITEYTAKIEALLSNSKSRISVSDAIDRPLEEAIVSLIGSSGMNEAEKDAAVGQLGKLQALLHQGIGREISPRQAYGIARTIGDAANWGYFSDFPEELRPAYRAVYGAVRESIRAAVPEAREMDERLANLYAAKSELESIPVRNAMQA